MKLLGVETKQVKAVKSDPDPDWGSVLRKRMFFHRGLS